MTIKVSESNQPFRIDTNGFDMSSETSLKITLTAPDGTETVHTDASSPPVTAPAVALVDDAELGNVPASTYFELKSDITTFTLAGEWSACAVYTDTATTPDTILNAKKVTFTIGGACS